MKIQKTPLLCLKLPLRLKFLFILWSFFAVGCMHFPRPTKNQMLFPLGTYQHQLDLHIEKTNQNFQFNGVVHLTEDQLRLYMLGPMNVSALKISETFSTGEIKIENQFEQFKAYEGKMKSLYFILRSLILYPKDQSQWAALRVEKRSSSGDIQLFKGPSGIEIEIKKYHNGLPVLFEVRQTQFQATVTDIKGAHL